MHVAGASGDNNNNSNKREGGGGRAKSEMAQITEYLELEPAGTAMYLGLEPPEQPLTRVRTA